jgi:hypothetical protein
MASFAAAIAWAGPSTDALPGRHDAVDQTHREGLRGVDRPAGQHQILRAGRTDQARQPLRATAPGNHPQGDLGDAEPSIGGRHPPVAGERDLAPAAQGVPVDRGDHRLGDLRKRTERRAECAGPGPHLVVGHLLQLLDVRAGGEDLLPAVDDDGSDGVVRGHLLGGGVELVLHLRVQRVHRRPVQPDGPDPLSLLQPYEIALSRPRLRPAQPSHRTGLLAALNTLRTTRAYVRLAAVAHNEAAYRRR